MADRRRQALFSNPHLHLTSHPIDALKMPSEPSPHEQQQKHLCSVIAPEPDHKRHKGATSDKKKIQYMPSKTWM